MRVDPRKLILDWVKNGETCSIVSPTARLQGKSFVPTPPVVEQFCG